MPLKMFQNSNTSGIQRVKKIIGIASGKGGVGKSTVTTHLARAFQKKGQRVGVLDSDLYGPSLQRMLPEEVPPKRIDTGIIPAVSSGLKIISMAHFRSERQASLVRAPIANGIVRQFAESILWGDLDILLVDFPPGTGDIQLTLCQLLPIHSVVLVTTPQKVALMDVLKALSSFEDLKVPIAGVVENMSYWKDPVTGERNYLFGKEGGRYFARSSGLPFLGEIPIDPQISLACDRGETLPDPIAKEFLKIADELLLVQDPIHPPKVSLEGPELIQIEWPDGRRRKIHASKLQGICPCAKCLENGVVEEGVQALQVIAAGRYGFRVRFSSGCSAGIYDLGAMDQHA
jgi:ATP-binding protein involved in chromosome partitioning